MKQGVKLWPETPVCLLELNSQLMFADFAVFLNDDTHAIPFDKLLHQPSDCSCSRLVDCWTPCPFSAAATDAASLACIFFHASREVPLHSRPVPISEVTLEDIIDFGSGDISFCKVGNI
ncbi:unnamed protein product [Taenia asiatica]|uniref:Uncharacterized protein n=1 Tax=Taenia asiatica TaxID=60517 RepID=A0A0R3VZL0_TAEAS|nr:unnamed protein product [Taenia asiatica]